MQKLLPFFERVIPSDPRFLDAAVEEVTKARGGAANWDDVKDIALALREALASAIIHGNDCNPEKTVEISVGVNENCDLVIIVKDSGPGLDPRPVPKPTVEDNVLADHGRGIFIIQLVMHQVDFKFDHGTEIYMRRRRSTNRDVESRAD
jgi:anti-sigma regulatory factor (Ser/Thr protein kinase)